MRSDVFYWVLNMSIFGGMLCLIVLLLRRIPGLPKLFVYGLWALPFARLVCPVGVMGQYNLMEQLVRLGVRRVPAQQILGTDTQITDVVVGANSLQTSSLYESIQVGNFTQFAEQYSPIRYDSADQNVKLLFGRIPVEATVLEQVMETAALVWFTVAVCLVLGALLLYRFSVREGRLAVKTGEYYLSDRVKVPAVYGIFRGRIVLPPDIRQQDISYVLCHERVHLRRRDNLWRCVAVLVCCVHWFNPICWLSLRCFFADMELACDAAAVGPLSEDQRKQYSHAILNAALERSLFTSAFGGAKVSARIRNLLSYRKLTAVSAVAFVVLFIAVAYVLVTN